MLSSAMLRTELAHYQILAEQLKAAYADIDDETLCDTLEGISELPELIQQIMRSSLEDETLAKALKARIEEMQARLNRFNLRVEKKREMVTWAMGSAGLARVMAEDFSVSLRQGAQRVEVLDEGQIPDEFFVPQEPRLDRGNLLAALKRGKVISGASLVYGAPHISVRVK